MINICPKCKATMEREELNIIDKILKNSNQIRFQIKSIKINRWDKINFGNNKKVQNKTLPQVIFIDPDWFFFQYERENSYLKRQFGSVHQSVSVIQ